MLFYWSRLYAKGIVEGKQYGELHKTIAILIANFEIGKLKEIKKFYTKWQIKEEEYTSVILTDKLELYIIELPKAKNNMENNEVLKQIKPWLDFLESPKDMEMNNMSKENKEAIKEAKKVLEEISANEHERYIAELRDKYIWDQNQLMSYGQRKGREETKIEIAKNMLNERISIDVIVKITGLTKEEIEKLK